ncbi:hypothetical protein, partial [Bradyrhizobium sp. 147]|uniref:hypothetical protein n=1 Tax=Bradyrhizobium sp. 147 TaxID=2782623 RepID=UPI001FFA23C7
RYGARPLSNRNCRLATGISGCTSGQVLEAYNGISTAVGWLALGLVGAVLAAAFAVRATMPAAASGASPSLPGAASLCCPLFKAIAGWRLQNLIYYLFII